MSNYEIYQMRLSDAIKTIPAAQLAKLVQNQNFSSALVRACKKVTAK